MFELFRRKSKPEALPEKFARLFKVHAALAASSRALIPELAQGNQPALLIANHSHLVHDLGSIAVMQWRLGDDPHTAIADAHAAYRDLIACRNRVDPGHALPMDQIAGITDWDMIYALFWLAGTPEPPVMHFPRLLEARYFAYSRFLLLRVTGAEVPAALAAAVARHQSGNGLVERDFRDKLALLDGDGDGDGDAETLIARIEDYWPKRRHNGFYRTSAPLPAGHDVSNDLSVDWQLACILRMKGIACRHSPHAWH